MSIVPFTISVPIRVDCPPAKMTSATFPFRKASIPTDTYFCFSTSERRLSFTHCSVSRFEHCYLLQRGNVGLHVIPRPLTPHRCVDLF